MSNNQVMAAAFGDGFSAGEARSNDPPSLGNPPQRTRFRLRTSVRDMEHYDTNEGSDDYHDNDMGNSSLGASALGDFGMQVQRTGLERPTSNVETVGESMEELWDFERFSLNDSYTVDLLVEPNDAEVTSGQVGSNEKKTLERLERTLERNEKDSAWKFSVFTLKCWMKSHGWRWPIHRGEVPFPFNHSRSDIDEENQYALFLANQRQGMQAFLNDDQRKSNGLTKERVDYLDLILPGWREGTDKWSILLEQVLAWRKSHPDLWPRHCIRGYRYAMARNQTRNQAFFRMSYFDFMDVDIEIDQSKLHLYGDLSLEEVHELKLAQFLSYQIQAEKNLFSRPFLSFDEGITMERVQELDEKLPGWDTANDCWNERFEALKEWRRKHGAWPRVLIGIKERKMNSEELEEHRLSKILRYQIRATREAHRGNRGSRRTYTLSKKNIKRLDKDLPGWRTVKFRLHAPRYPLPTWFERIHSLQKWYEDHGRREPQYQYEENLSESQEEEHEQAAWLVELRAARNAWMKGSRNTLIDNKVNMKRVEWALPWL